VVLGLTLPATIACALFSDDVVFVFLGPNWQAAAAIVRLLAPTIVIFAIINPLGWVIWSLGLEKRGLVAAPILASLLITGYVVALPYGPRGVAFAYSAVMTLLLIPLILFCVYRTPISFRDILLAVSPSLASGILAGGLAFATGLIFGQFVSPFPRLLLESGVLVVTFFGVLLFAAGQKPLYLDLLRELRGPS